MKLIKSPFLFFSILLGVLFTGSAIYSLLTVNKADPELTITSTIGVVIGIFVLLIVEQSLLNVLLKHLKILFIIEILLIIKFIATIAFLSYSLD